MFSQKGINGTTKNYWDNIRHATELMQSAEYFIVGIGSGMTAAGGLCYTDPKLAQKWYPEYFALGKKSIVDIMSNFWPPALSKKNVTTFWGFWAKHIYHIRYEADVLQPYTDLFTLLKNKRYFICSTNVDGQLEKAGFAPEDIFAPQGDYALFQCQRPCSRSVCNNRNQIGIMLENMINGTEISSSDIPYCPSCGRFMIPHLRCDVNFIETFRTQQNAVRYGKYIKKTVEKRCVFLELGVGFNTPSIIRFPFEKLALANDNASLVRVNITHGTVPAQLTKKCIVIAADICGVLNDIIAVIE